MSSDQIPPEMSEQLPENHCKNCHRELSGEFCSHCGQPKHLKRIDKSYVFHEIGSVLNFDKGILFSIKELLIRPGKSVRTFIHEDRNRLVKPILFIILCSLIYTAINQFFHLESGYMKYEGSKDLTIYTIVQWIQNHYGYANIIMGIFIAGWVKIFFRKFSYNFFEILILICFVMGMAMLIFTFFALLQGITAINFMQIGGIVGFIYPTWAIGQFFNKKKFFNYVKAVGAYVLGFISFTFAALGIGLLIDVIIK